MRGLPCCVPCLAWCRVIGFLIAPASDPGKDSLHGVLSCRSHLARWYVLHDYGLSLFTIHSHEPRIHLVQHALQQSLIYLVKTQKYPTTSTWISTDGNSFLRPLLAAHRPALLAAHPQADHMAANLQPSPRHHSPPTQYFTQSASTLHNRPAYVITTVHSTCNRHFITSPSVACQKGTVSHPTTPQIDFTFSIPFSATQSTTATFHHPPDGTADACKSAARNMQRSHNSTTHHGRTLSCSPHQEVPSSLSLL
eukprot:5288027-Amphidinium_carterae.1